MHASGATAVDNLKPAERHQLGEAIELLLALSN
jgi:hypothetical protein